MNGQRKNYIFIGLAAVALLGLVVTVKINGVTSTTALNIEKPAQPATEQVNDDPRDTPPDSLKITAPDTNITPEIKNAPGTQTHILVCNPPLQTNAANTACILPPEKLASSGISALIPVTGGPLKLDCRPNTLELSGGNRVVIRGLCGNYWAAVVQETKESLPQASSLYTFTDGITLQILEGQDISSLTPLVDMPPGTLISYDFLVTPQMAEYHLLGLQLSADTWQEVGSARGGIFMEIPANKPGTFVMAAP